MTQPKFPVGIIAPAVGNPICRKGTGVTCTSTDVNNDGPDRHHNQYGDKAINDGTITNLPAILPPTVGHTSGCQGAGVIPAGPNGTKRYTRGHRHHGRSGCVGGGTIPDLPGSVPPPAVGNPPCGKCTDIVATHTYRSNSYASGHRHCHRCGAISGRTIT